MSDDSRLRLAVLGMVVLSLFAAMFTRLWYLQVMDSRTFVQAAETNQIRRVYEPAPRGRILDRQGRVLVDNRVSRMVTLERAAAKDNPEVIPRLATLLGISADTVQERLADPRFSFYRPVPVAEDVDERILVYIREHRDAFPGVKDTLLAQRTYPNGSLAAHLLGYVGEINDKELDEQPRGAYRLGDNIGKSGVEKVHEADLRGQAGVVELEVDSSGKVVGRRDPTPAVQGDDVQLTIDLDVQRLAEESLAQGLGAARATHDRNSKKSFIAPAGAVVVMDPRDGSVLALASHPTFDPSAFVNGIKPEVFRVLQDPGSQYPLNNRAIQGQYAPGSTFKLITSAAAVQSGLITPGTTVLDQGAFRLRSCRGEKCVFRNAGGRSYGRVNLARAITVSSDVYFYSVGASFWTRRSQFGDAMQETARRFGLGARTGIPLPGEKAGRVPDPESRRRLHEANPKAFPNGNWYTGDNVNLAIGQGEMVLTPLQLANAYATFANGGTVYEPRVAARVMGGEGSVVREVPSAATRTIDLPLPMREAILQGLYGATADPRGTARGAFIGFPLEDFAVAGKTGTAQVVGKQDTALFVAFGPIESPAYVVAVVMEEAGFGGAAAAPVARRIFQGLHGQPPGPVSLASGVD